MLKRRPWRRVVYRFSAVTIMLSVLSVGALAFAPLGGAAVQTGPSASISATQKSETNTPGKNPHSRLCKKVSQVASVDRIRQSTITNLASGKWTAYQKFILATEDANSKISQTLIDVGKNVPTSVRAAARQVVKNAAVMRKRILRARSIAQLNALVKGTKSETGPESVAAQGDVLEYLGSQCG
jgi:hypothetical protein